MMRRKIFVEGPDGAGKSTLVASISARYQIPSKHAGGPPQTETEFRDRIIDVICSDVNLWDRIPMISEQVYGHAAGRDTMIPVDILDDYLCQCHPIVIYCRPPTSVMIMSGEKKDHKTEDHIRMVSEKHQLIVSVYDRLMIRLVADLDLHVIWFDRTTVDPDILIEELRPCVV